jgi:O-antigen/teichoic acid export membrane protein
MKLSLILIAPLAAGLILALPSLIVFLYGPEFSAALPFAILVTLAAVFAVPNSLLGEQYLLATGRTKTSLLVTLYSVAVSLGLIVVLLPSQGALALPVASLVAESTLFAILVGVAGRRNELDVSRLAPTLALGLAVAAAVGVAQLAFSSPLGIFLAMPVWAGVFFGGLFFLLSGEERSALRSVLHYVWRKVRGG